MSKTIAQILNDRPIHSIAPGATLAEAARAMAAQAVGALVVLEGEVLAGIVSERDLVFRGLAEGLAPDTTPVSAVMTRDPVSIGLHDAIADALKAHLGEDFRHLPVMDGDRVAGLLSYRDIPAEYLMMYERFREMSGAHADDAP